MNPLLSGGRRRVAVSPRRRVGRSLLVAALLFPPAAVAQQNVPHIGYVYPAGGKQGATFEITVGGQFLDGVSNAIISGPGVKAAIVEHKKLMTQGEFMRLRDQLQELMEKRQAAAKQQRKRFVSLSPAEEKTIAEIREKITGFIRRPANASIAELVRLRVELSPDAAPGERELRLAARNGVTNPMVFCVGQLPEFSKPPSPVLADPAILGNRFNNQLKAAAAQPVIEVKLPAILNGQILPGAIDRYRFAARKGQHLIVSTAARELVPYISDAVPGWFQAVVALYDAKGKEVDYAGSYRFHPDPVLHYEVPADGDYTLEIHDSIYRGREDFVYRIAVGELPFVSSIFPLGGRAGARTTVEVRGWNLPVSKLTPETRAAGHIVPVSVRRGEWLSNRVPFAVDALPESLEKEPNNDAKKAVRVKLPLIVNGRIEQPGDQDVFRFDGRAGEEIVAEVMARRLDSPLDSILRLTDAKGRQLAANDDSEDKGSALLTHHADSRLRFKLPAKGAYYVYLSDTQRKGGPEYGYRLRIGKPQPDFELRVTPSAINARGGATVPVTVYALRKDGFSGEIALRLKDAPPGFALGGGLIRAGQDKVRVTLTVPPQRTQSPVPLNLEGRAGQLTHLAVPAEDMMQAFAYHHLVPAKEWMATVIYAGRSVPWKLVSEKPVKLAAGGSATVPLLVPRSRLTDELQLTLNEPPEGVAIQGISGARDGLAILLRADAKAKPGVKGNLIVDAFMERAADNKKKTAAQRRFPIGTLPAIPFEIVK